MFSVYVGRVRMYYSIFYTRDGRAYLSVPFENASIAVRLIAENRCINSGSRLYSSSLMLLYNYCDGDAWNSPDLAISIASLSYRCCLPKTNRLEANTF